jgi:hypothetical protein
MPFVSQVLVRVNDVALSLINDELRLAGVDNSTAGLLRRLGLHWLAGLFGGAPTRVHAAQPEAYFLRGEVSHAVRDSRF